MIQSARWKAIGVTIEFPPNPNVNKIVYKLWNVSGGQSEKDAGSLKEFRFNPRRKEGIKGKYTVSKYSHNF